MFRKGRVSDKGVSPRPKAAGTGHRSGDQRLEIASRRLLVVGCQDAAFHLENGAGVTMKDDVGAES